MLILDRIESLPAQREEHQEERLLILDRIESTSPYRFRLASRIPVDLG